MHPSALLSYISMRGFLRTREKCKEKHEAQPIASRTSQDITQQCTRMKEIARAQTHCISSVHYNSIKHARDISSMLYGAIMNSN